MPKNFTAMKMKIPVCYFIVFPAAVRIYIYIYIYIYIQFNSIQTTTITTTTTKISITKNRTIARRRNMTTK